MKAKQQHLLWRVEWTHRNGYQAPYRYVEAKKMRDAIKLAKGTSRLGDFPESWSYNLVKLFDS